MGQFSLKTLFLITAIIAIGMGCIALANRVFWWPGKSDLGLVYLLHYVGIATVIVGVLLFVGLITGRMPRR
jgi:hypothetical protein